MLTTRENGLLRAVIKHCKRIEYKTKNITKDDFDNNEDIRDICCFNIFQIGELTKNFSFDFLSKYNKMPWKNIKGMRDWIGHGYGSIIWKDIWNTAVNEITPLRVYCETILNENKE